jgi:hypothetical protein
MTIKRRHITVYEEIDDGTTTEFPVPDTSTKDNASNIEEATNIPSLENSLNMEPDSNSDSCVVGRTFPDLIIESINNFKIITVILLFCPFPVFISKINSFEDMKYPLVIGLGLNIVWYVISFINWIIKKIK